MVYRFSERLAFSQGIRQQSDLLTIRGLLPGTVTVRVAEPAEDRLGIDYVATLRRGAKVLIDAKARSRGCSRHWKDGKPELAIERWSVRPGGKYGIARKQAKVGWTLDESKRTDMVLYSFDPADSNTAFLLAFQTLRVATWQHYDSWRKRYKLDVQDSGAWESEAIFVPHQEVRRAMHEAQQGWTRYPSLLKLSEPSDGALTAAPCVQLSMFA